jgi:hypothetical protein
MKNNAAFRKMKARQSILKQTDKHVQDSLQRERKKQKRDKKKRDEISIDERIANKRHKGRMKEKIRNK